MSHFVIPSKTSPSHLITTSAFQEWPLPNLSILNIFQQEDVSVQLEALDILADLLSRFGGLLISFHPMLLNSLLPQLASPRQVIKKNYSSIYDIKSL